VWPERERYCRSVHRPFSNVESLLGTTVEAACREIHRQYHILPKTIRQYIKCISSCLDYILSAQCDNLTLADKYQFFAEMRHAFGRTALVLSGGGALGAFHLVCAWCEHASFESKMLAYLLTAVPQVRDYVNGIGFFPSA
jgi:hypothetical protein